MRIKSFVVLALLMGVSLCTFSFGLEKQLSFLEGKELYTINRELNNKLGIYTNYSGFSSASIFQFENGLIKLEILFNSNNQVFRQITPLSQGELSLLQKKFTEEYHAYRIKRPEQTGRKAFVFATTSLSLSIYGTLVPMAFGIDQEKTVLFAHSAIAATGFFYPFFASKRWSISESAGINALNGGILGSLHGMMLSQIIMGENFFDNRANTKVSSGLITLTSLAELYFGYQAARKFNMSAGQAWLVAGYSYYGALYGLSIGIAINNRIFTERLIPSLSLAGSGGGVLLGKYTGERINYSVGDAYLSMELGALGFLTGFSFAELTGLNDPSYSLAISSLFSAAGLLLANNVAKKENFSENEGLFMALGEGIGALLGFGLGYLINDDLNAEALTYMTSIGAGGGMYLLYRHFRQKTNHSGLKKNSKLKYYLRLHPETLLLGRLHPSSLKYSTLPLVVFRLII